MAKYSGRTMNCEKRSGRRRQRITIETEIANHIQAGRESRLATMIPSRKEREIPTNRMLGLYNKSLSVQTHSMINCALPALQHSCLSATCKGAQCGAVPFKLER